MVWDPSSNSGAGGVNTFDQVSSPALTGVFTVERSFRALFRQNQHSSSCPIELPPSVQKQRRLTLASLPDVVNALANDYVTRTPATIMASMGIDRWGNGYLNGRAIGTLAALTGNIGVSGATPMSEIAGYAGMYTYDYRWLTPSGTSAIQAAAIIDV